MICAKILVLLVTPWVAMASPAEKAVKNSGSSDQPIMDMTAPEEVVGIGVVVFADKGHFKVSEIIPNTPAELVNNINPGDQILQVRASELSNWTVVDGLTLRQVVYLIRGPANSIIGLRLRDQNGNDKEVNLVRKPLQSC